VPSSRRAKSGKETEKAKMNVGSREFVRGGRGRMRGSARGRGGRTAEQQDAHEPALYRGAESTGGQSEMGVDSSNTHVASAATNSPRVNGTEQKRLGNGRAGARHSKAEEGRPRTTTTTQKLDAEDGGHVQSPSDDRGGSAQDSLLSGGAKATAGGRRSDGRRGGGTEFYDSRNRGHRIRRSDARATDAGNLQQQQQAKCGDAKASSRTAPASDGADGTKSTTSASGQNVAGSTSRINNSNVAAAESTSQRKSGEN